MALGQPNDALYWVVVGAVAGVEDHVDLEVLARPGDRPRPVDLESVAEDRELLEGMFLTDFLQVRNELLGVDGFIK